MTSDFFCQELYSYFLSVVLDRILKSTIQEHFAPFKDKNHGYKDENFAPIMLLCGPDLPLLVIVRP